MVISKNKVFIVLLFLAIHAASGCMSEIVEQEPNDILECGDERSDLLTITSSIVNGSDSFDPEVVMLLPGQVLAVGALMQRSRGSWEDICTGTLVASGVVITAKHCLETTGRFGTELKDPDELAFAIGSDAATAPRIPVREVKIMTE